MIDGGGRTGGGITLSFASSLAESSKQTQNEEIQHQIESGEPVQLGYEYNSDSQSLTFNLSSSSNLAFNSFCDFLSNF